MKFARSDTRLPSVAALVFVAAAASGCQLAAPDPPPVRYLPTLSYHPGAVLLVEAHGMRLLEDPAGPVRWRQKISANLQFEMLRLEGIVKLNPPGDWQTKQVHVSIVTEAGANSKRLAKFLERKSFTDLRIHTTKNSSIETPPGSVSGYLPYQRLLVLDEVADQSGVARIQEIRSTVQLSGQSVAPSAPQSGTPE